VRIELKKDLVEALGVCPGDLVSLVGAGGKTSLMYGLGRELAVAGRPVFLTTTTRIRNPEGDQVRSVVLGPETDVTLKRAFRDLKQANMVLVGLRREDSKIVGFSPSFVERLHGEGSRPTVVSECDGARGRSLKLPRQDEPPLAATTDVYVVVVGADCLGKPLGSEAVFEPERVAAFLDASLDTAVDTAMIRRLILSEDSYGGRKPARSRMGVFINKVDIQSLGSVGGPADGGGNAVMKLALDLVKNGHVERVLLGSVRAAGRRPIVVLR
jgi:probable selenium-dependent hydroxylase accessory protein YqeC